MRDKTVLQFIYKMEPPKAKTTHKKRGNIYFAGTCLVSGPFEIKDNEVFGAEGGNKAMKASVEKKKGIKTTINALQDSLFMKRKSRLGKKPPHSTIKYQHIKHYYQYAQEENIVILALQQPKMRKQYIALKFEDAATTAKFCDIVQYASVAPSHNLKNAAPMAEAPAVMASGRQSAQNPSAPASVIEETAVPPPRALTPSRSVSRSSSTSSSASLSHQSATATAQSSTAITEIIEREPAISQTQSRDGSTRRNSQLSAASSDHLPQAVLVEARVTPSSRSSSPKPQALSPQAQTLSESRTSQRSLSSVEAHHSPSPELEAIPPNKLCPRCGQANLCLVNSATSPVLGESSNACEQCASKSSVSPHQLRVQPDAPYPTETRRQEVVPPTDNNLPQRQLYGVTEYFVYQPAQGKSSKYNHDSQLIEEVICLEQNRQPTIARTPASRSSSSSSYSERYQNSIGATSDRPTENQMILASNNFHPLSVLTKNGKAENSLNDMCSICGAVGEGGPMELKVLRVDVDGQPKISPDGAVYMYSSTKRLTPEDSENVDGYHGRHSQLEPSQIQPSQSQPSHHHHRKHRTDGDHYKKSKEEMEYKFQFLRLENSSSSSDSEDSISRGPRRGGTFNIRHI